MHSVHPWQVSPIIKKKTYINLPPQYTVVMPVYNQGNNVCKVLECLYNSASFPYSIIIINDGSDDNSEEIIIKYFEQSFSKNKKVVDFIYIYNKFPIYETACDNIGFRISSTYYIIEIQSDIYIEDYGFDRRMISAMQKYSLGAVSGRHVHNYSLIDNSSSWLRYPIKKIGYKYFKKRESIGLVGNKIFSRSRDLDYQKCYIGETVARGPWLLNKADLQVLGYLDQKNFFLGNDDHDYHLRLGKSLSKAVGYCPVNIYSVPEEGASRKKRSGTNLEIYDYLKKVKTGSLEFKKFLRSYSPYREIITCDNYY